MDVFTFMLLWLELRLLLSSSRSRLEDLELTYLKLRIYYLSASYKSAKYGCFKACLAVNRFSGLYAKHFSSRSMHSFETLGMRACNPVPFF